MSNDKHAFCCGRSFFKELYKILNVIRRFFYLYRFLIRFNLVLITNINEIKIIEIKYILKICGIKQ